MQLIDLALHIPKFVPEKLCNDVIKFYSSKPIEERYREEYNHPEFGDGYQSSGEILQIESHDDLFPSVHNTTSQAIELWLQHINSFKKFNTNVLRALTRTSHKYRIIKYSKGDKIDNHCDVGWSDEHLYTMTIRGSCTLNFSEDYDGGEFVLFDTYKIKLGRGDMIIFPADAFWVHRTIPIVDGTRYCINSFLHPNISMFDRKIQ